VRRPAPELLAVIAIALTGCGRPRRAPHREDARLAGDVRDAPSAPPPRPADLPPTPPPIRIPASEAVIRQLECPAGTAHPVPGVVQKRQRVEAFAIDETTTSCARFRACVAAGACEGSDMRDCTYGGDCCHGAAFVPATQATAYCAWQHARLPSYAQWQRAVRGTEGRVFPHPMGQRWDPALACEHPSSTSQMRRCLHRSDDGVEYATENRNMGEWTRDLDCARDGGLHLAPVNADLLGTRLDLPNVARLRAEFRCVTE